MSVIAWDGKHLVGDNQVTNGSQPKKIQKVFGFIRKGIRHGIGYVGNAGEGLELVEWYKAGADADSLPVYPDTELVVCTASWCLSICDGSKVPFRIHEKYYATGSGGTYADSALILGKTARQAVLHAIQNDVYCGLGTRSIKL